MSKCKIFVPWWHVAVVLTLCVCAATAIGLLLLSPEAWRKIPAAIVLVCGVGGMCYVVR